MAGNMDRLATALGSNLLGVSPESYDGCPNNVGTCTVFDQCNQIKCPPGSGPGHFSCTATFTCVAFQCTSQEFECDQPGFQCYSGYTC